MLYDKFVITKKTIKRRSLLLQFIAGITVWSMLPMFIAMHVCVWVYQSLYFSILDIPKVKMKDYVTFDRLKLRKLNIGQKAGCIYCQYANGIAAWVKAVANRTEIYSCAIKRQTAGADLEYQKEFMPYEDFQ